MTTHKRSAGKNRPDRPVSIAVIGSVNLDLVAAAPKLPSPGETVTGATLSRYPGGKGANQALAARRLGAEVKLLAKTGSDAASVEALALLRAEGVDLSGCVEDAGAATGVALIVVAEGGENQIVVAPGANAKFAPSQFEPPDVDAVICQLEIPLETVAKAAAGARFFCLNAAPARTLPEDLVQRVDLLVVNESEAAFYGEALRRVRGNVAITYGAEGARLFSHGEEIASARPPKIDAVDTTGAGDAFTAALVVALVEGRDAAEALGRACAAGALAATRAGAQPSFPSRAEVDSLLAVR